MNAIATESTGPAPNESADRIARLPEGYVCSKVGRDLTWLSRQKEMPPVVGREEDIERVFRRLCAPRAKSLLVIGEPGSGKTALIEEVAARLADGRCPEVLRHRRLIQTSFTEMWAHAGKAEDWAAYGKILKGAIAECSKHRFVLVLEEFHMVAGYEFSMSFLRPALASGELCIVGTATEREFYNYLEPDRATLRRFEIVRVHEPSPETTLNILVQRGPQFETETGYALPDPPMLRTVVQLADAYIVHQAQPGKSIALLERTAERKVVRGDPAPITEDDVGRAVAETVGIDYELMHATSDRLRAMESVLNSRVLGQENVVARLCRRLHVSKSSLSVTPERPSGVFLAVGPTGVGKSMLAVELARFFTGSDRDLIRLDMNAFVTADAAYAIAGVPGEQSTDRRQFMPSFTRQLRSRPYSVVLLDEIEKAHPRVLLLFLQAIDSGRFADNLGNEASLRGCIVLMTSNVGHSTGRRRVGLTRTTENIEAETLRAVKETFPREFLGRVDEILVFRPLTRDIMRSFVAARIRTLEGLTGKTIELSRAALELLCDRGFHAEYGARELNRTIDELLGYPLALVKASVEWGRAVRIHADTAPGGEALVVEPIVC